MTGTPRIVALGRTGLAGRSDGVQVMVAHRHAYVGHLFSDGITVVDVADPRSPKPVRFVACPPHTRASHIQVHDGLLLAVNCASVGDPGGGFAAGLRVYDLADPAAPREIGFMPVSGAGLHRMWWVGGRYVYASAHFEGFTDHIMAVIDLSDPTRPEVVGRWWLPGMHRASGETPGWTGGRRFAHHHMIVAGGLGYATWRDGGFTLMDLADPVAPKLLRHLNWSPPYPGGTHTPLPLPGRRLVVVADEAMTSRCEGGLARAWVLDVRAPDNPVTIATLPTPAELDFCNLGGRFGPHNLHENRPGSWQSEELIFATYQNAGVRAFDLKDAYAPREVARFIPAAPTSLMDLRPSAELVTQSSDIFAGIDGTLYVTDTNAGLSTLAFEP